jgi:hypothetical protein
MLLGVSDQCTSRLRVCTRIHCRPSTASRLAALVVAAAAVGCATPWDHVRKRFPTNEAPPAGTHGRVSVVFAGGKTRQYDGELRPRRGWLTCRAWDLVRVNLLPRARFGDRAAAVQGYPQR